MSDLTPPTNLRDWAEARKAQLQVDAAPEREATIVSSPPVDDHEVRDLVTERGLDETLFVEAGAGTGKTTLLVDRIVNLVLHQGHSLRSIAAITFTEAAAAELQSRVRSRFERHQAEAIQGNDSELAERCAAAIDEVDLAAISTLHGFANRILSEFSVAAGLPPRVRVLDEVSSQLAHEDRWHRFVDRLYDDVALTDLLTSAAALEVDLEPRYPRHATLRDVAVVFNENWDRLASITGRGRDPLPTFDFTEFDEAVNALRAWIPVCEDPGDKLLAHLNKIVPEMQAIVDVEDPHRKLRLLGNRRRPGRGWGKSRSGAKLGWGDQAPQVKDDIVAVNEAVAATLEPITDHILVQLSSLIADDTVKAAETRRDEGGLEFHDLLVLARNLLRTDNDARRSLHERYTHLLLDEFQDTDPIQIELAVLIATDADANDVETLPWSRLHVPAGRLFFVGDPKQSIYRFRRADISLFLRARDRFAPGAGLHLTRNFRTVGPILEWINAMFGRVMPEELAGRQPRYQPLVATREPRPENLERHRPILLGGPHPDPKITSAELRAAEAAEVVQAIRAVLDSPAEFPVQYQDRGGSRRWRAPEPGDITILLPTRTSLPFLKAALDEASIPHRISTGTLVYDTQEVVDALSAIRAIDDPADAISLIGALRSPLYACSDVDLFTWKRNGGHWDFRRDRPESIAPDHPVARAYEHLHGLWRERWFLTPSQLLERLLRERRATMLAFGSKRPGDVWRRLRFLQEQARAFEETGPGGLRAFTDWAALQSGSMARVHEPVLPETDEAAVSIQTIHGAKGLEFPIAILSGMTTKMQATGSGVSVLFDDHGAPEIRMRKGLETMRHEPRADLEAEMDQYERLRLAYVAATRARDHLIVSCHHKQNQADKTYGGLFWQVFQEPATRELVRQVDLAALVDDSPDGPPTASQLGFALDSRSQWIDRRRELLEASRHSRVLSATKVAAKAQASLVETDHGGGAPLDSDGIELPEQDDDGFDLPETGTPTRRRGRIGSAIGSAVHAVLEHVDLRDPEPDRVAALAIEQARNHGVEQHAFVVRQLAEAGLASEVVALAGSLPHHKELFVAAPVGGRMIEGYVDLLIEGPDGLIVVDYKTDVVRGDAEIDAKLDAYELQGASYAVALETTTGSAIAECRFVFLSTDGAIERQVRDLPDAMARVRATIQGPIAHRASP